MSRIGKLPVIIPDGVEVTIDGQKVTAKGPMGTETVVVREGKIIKDESQVGYIIRDDDVEAFTQEYPDTDYIVYEGVYDYYNDNRVPFFSIKKYEDLSYICVRVEGIYNIYQDITDLI